MLEVLLPGAQHLQNSHPLIVHFPIAFLYGAALFYFSAWVFENQNLARTAWWMLLLGTLAALAAVGTGLYSEPGVMISISVREEVLKWHKQWMLATTGLALVLSMWGIAARPFPRNGRRIFLFLILVLVAIMTKGADYGGRLVYDYNAGGYACSQPIEFTK